MKLAVVLFNLGGPDSPTAIEPFLRNLFSDPAILSLPWPIRLPMAAWIARRRSPIAREIYGRIGGRSPIVAETERQARALEQVLIERSIDARVFIAMRHWRPFSDGTAISVRNFAPDKVVLLPLYPQFSTTTAASSLKDWYRASAKAGLKAPTSQICCYPENEGFTTALSQSILETWQKRRPGISYRLLFSAHGLPERVIKKGDPYQWQIEQSASSLVEKLGITALDKTICYQSRVGSLRWIGPQTDDEIRRAGAEGLGVVVAPVSFVSEHAETLVELDMDYARLAQDFGVPHYLRAPAVGVRGAFIAGLADLALCAGTGRYCPAAFVGCGFREPVP